MSDARLFATGATRDGETGKLRFHAALSPYALEAYVDYMRRHNSQVHRCEENWKKGMPLDSFMGSAWRHLHAWWRAHEDGGEPDIDAIAGVIFNAFGYLHECVKPEPRAMLAEHAGEIAERLQNGEYPRSAEMVENRR